MLKKAISTAFGSDASRPALEIQISNIRKGPARKILDCLAAGGDPKDLNLRGEVKRSKSGSGQTFLRKIS